MRILVTGGYGFIGSHTVERLIKEGHEVHIIDNLVTGKMRNISSKVKHFLLDINDSKVEEIFASNLYNIVIHLAAQTSETSAELDPVKNEQANVCGLTNMLNLSKKYGVGKFIFTSSAVIYGNVGDEPIHEGSEISPESSFGLSKSLGEKCVHYYDDNVSMNTVILRLSNVYGPRETLSSEGSVIETLIDQLAHKKDLTIHGTGDQAYDFIYVSDVVEAIYRAVEYSGSMTLNVSAGKSHTLNQVVEMLQAISGDEISINNEEPLPTEVLYSNISNEMAKEHLTWYPRFELLEGLNKTYEWADEAEKVEQREKVKEEKRNARKNKNHPFLPYLENVLAFFFAVTLISFTRQVNIGVAIDFILFYIMIVAVTYGLKQSILAVVLATGFRVYNFLSIGQEPISVLFDANLLLQLSVYILIGAILGHTVDTFKNKINDNALEKRDIQGKFDHLYSLYQDSKIVRKELQTQILKTDDSFTKMYDVSMRLNSLKPDLIFDGTVRVFEDILKSHDIAIYMVSKNSDFLRLISSSNKLEKELKKSVAISDFPAAQKIMETKALYTNTELDPDAPMMMAPVVLNDEIRAFVVLYAAEFTAMTLYNQNLFKTLVDLVTTSLIRAYEYETVTDEQKFVSNTTVLKWDYFKEVLKSRISARADNDVSYTIIEIEDEKWREKDTYHVVDRIIRDIDYVGEGPRGELMLLLTNTNSTEAKFVVGRMEEKEVVVSIMPEARINDLFTSSLVH